MLRRIPNETAFLQFSFAIRQKCKLNFETKKHPIPHFPIILQSRFILCDDEKGQGSKGHGSKGQGRPAISVRRTRIISSSLWRQMPLWRHRSLSTPINDCFREKSDECGRTTLFRFAKLKDEPKKVEFFIRWIRILALLTLLICNYIKMPFKKSIQYRFVYICSFVHPLFTDHDNAVERSLSSSRMKI